MINPNLLIIVGVIGVGIFALIKLKKNFSERLFFQIGMYLFIVQALAGTYGLVIEWNALPFWAVIGKIGSLLFNYVIAYFFYYLTKNAPASMGGAGTQLTPEAINEFLKEDIKKGVENGKNS